MDEYSLEILLNLSKRLVSSCVYYSRETIVRQPKKKVVLSTTLLTRQRCCHIHNASNHPCQRKY
jgi:hypothetical protein